MEEYIPKKIKKLTIPLSPFRYSHKNLRGNSNYGEKIALGPVKLPKIPSGSVPPDKPKASGAPVSQVNPKGNEGASETNKPISKQEVQAPLQELPDQIEQPPENYDLKVTDMYDEDDDGPLELEMPEDEEHPYGEMEKENEQTEKTVTAWLEKQPELNPITPVPSSALTSVKAYYMYMIEKIDKKALRAGFSGDLITKLEQYVWNWCNSVWNTVKDDDD